VRKAAIPKSHAPRMAIILDDWGNNASLVRAALDIKRPLTLAVLPGLPHSRPIAEEAFRNKLGVMLHMPMQPKSGTVPLEPQTIMTSTSDAEIRRYIDEALGSIPHADGVNNHQGSAATCDRRVMKTVLTHLKGKGLFFVDSNVIPETVAVIVAGETGVPHAKRDVFIDNEPDVSSVKKRLEEAKQVALKRGQVVVIGHDKKATLQAIKEMVPEIEEEGVRLVLVRELVT